MKKRFVLGVIVILLLACEDGAISIEEFPNWVKLSVPNGREAYAIAGDIESTLLVTTLTKAYFTTDMGQTWVESKDFQGPVWGLMQRGDTLVALFSSGTNSDGSKHAATGYLYTLDLGRTWNFEPSKYLQSSITVGEVSSGYGVKYRIKENVTPISPGSSAFNINPSDIEKWPHETNDWGALAFPVKVKANNLHLDKKNRLYVAASSGTFDEKNCLLQGEKSPAWIFISKRPLPQ